MSLRYRTDVVDAGLDWIGAFPNTWSVRRLGHYFDERREKVSDKEFAPLSVTMQGVVPQLENVAKTDDGDNRKLVRRGDFVINSRSDRKGAAGIAQQDGSVSLINTVLQPQAGMNVRFGFYLLTSHPFQEEFYRVGNGIVADMWTTKFSEMKNIRLAVPGEREQEAIASHLDRTTARIDTLVAKKARFIELLREKRQALISHAVTKGLDVTAPMKESRVEWLGDVPAHWTTTKCGHYLSILCGFAFPSSGFDSEGNGTRLLRGVNVGVGKLRWDDVVFWRRTPCDGLDDFEMRVGDLVIGMDRPQIAGGVRVAHVTNADLPCLLLQRVASLRTTPALSSEYLFYCLSTPMFAAHFAPDTTGISVPHISPEQIASFVIALPPFDEQRRIVDHIKSTASKLDTLMAKTERTIELLREHRTAVIAAAVTGKIDLRDPA